MHNVCKRNHTVATEQEEMLELVWVSGPCSESSKAHGRVRLARNACNHRNMTYPRNMSKYSTRPEQWSEAITLLLATRENRLNLPGSESHSVVHHHTTTAKCPKVSDDKNIKHLANCRVDAGFSEHWLVSTLCCRQHYFVLLCIKIPNTKHEGRNRPPKIYLYN